MSLGKRARGPFDGARMSTEENWFQTFFRGVVVDLWRRCMTPEHTRADVAFLEKLLGRRKRLLDVPCGDGRHSLALARRGARVTGIDISPEFIAAANAQARTARLRAEFVVGDMRRLKWRSEFDGAFCFGNAFGYFVHDDMVKFVRGVARALKPGGRFVIEACMTAETLLASYQKQGWFHDGKWERVGDIRMREQHRYLADRSCLETRATFVRDGRTVKRTYWHWIYTVGEIRRLLAQAGLVTRNLFGGQNREPFELGSPALYIVAEKPRTRPPRRR
jgi:SAM-dependent methyltransferase